jgi:hypothetical protein
VQTQATGIYGTTIVGFWSGTNLGPNNGVNQDANYGFIKTVKSGKTQFTLVNDATGSVPATAQVLGINASQNAVGFYVDAHSLSHGFVYALPTSTYTPVSVQGSTQVVATGINASNLICGNYTDSSGVMHAFLEPLTGGTAIKFTVPGAAVTQFLGVNSSGEAVGFYQLTPNDITHGLLYNPANGVWQTLDNPGGVGGTAINGVNDKGQAVGFYTDAAGNVHGMLINNAF